ncbi:MAG: hypothetical protein IJ626_03330 [Muribaculaceae bacterium]|nr:hypothetical protein [Muribaculaceae bacterium]
MFEFSDSFFRLKYGIIYLISPEQPDMEYVNRVMTFLSCYDDRGRMCECRMMIDRTAPSLSLVALRFNIGNIGQRAILKSPLTGDFRRDTSEIRLFARFYFNDFRNGDSGNYTIKPFMPEDSDLIGYRPIGPGDIPFMRPYEPDELTSESTEELEINERLASKSQYGFSGGSSYDGEMMAMSIAPADEDEDEADEFDETVRQRERDLRQLQAAILNFVMTYNEDPSAILQQQIRGKFIIGNDSLSDVTINGDLQVVLPGYNETVVEMPALCRCLYILFLKHPEGLRLSELVDHSSELKEIYFLIKPGSRESVVESKIRNLVDMTSNSINENISRIKRAFNSLILKSDVAKRYYISGSRGGTYAINIPPERVRLPRILQD